MIDHLEIEQSILGAALLDGDCAEQMVLRTHPSEFLADKRHPSIAEAIHRLNHRGEVADLATVTCELRATGDLDKKVEASFLSSLVDYVPSLANAEYYLRKHEEVTNRRRLYIALESTISILRGGGSVEEAQEIIESAMTDCTCQKSEPESAINILPRVIADIERATLNLGRILGLSTGFSCFDELTGGLQPGDLLVVAGRPGMGKTALALNIAEHVAIKTAEAKSVLIFSMEMSKEQLVERLIASMADIDTAPLRAGHLGSDGFLRLKHAASKIQSAPIMINDSPAMSVSDLKAIARKAKRQHGVSLVIVDYLQLMRGTGENRTQEVGDISRNLKALAKGLDVPIIALAQLNRGLENRVNKRPVLADLRDSGEIEQDADMVAFIYRESMYNDKANKRAAEFILAKQRRGPTGTVRLSYVGNRTRFEDWQG